MGNLQTVVHAYNLDTRKPEDKAAYKLLRNQLRGWPSKMKSPDGGKSSYYFGFGQKHDGQTISLETDFLFNNQWNTAPLPGSEKGWRVFDWAEDAIYNDYGTEDRHTRRGY